MPITATVMAMKAAMGLIACIAKEAAKTVIKVINENKITAVPTANFLWLKTLPSLLYFN